MLANEYIPSVLKGFVPAISALAWYYEQYEHDYRKAVELWEKADLLGCPDAALNLGVFYSLGLFPGKPASQVSSSVKFVGLHCASHICLFLGESSITNGFHSIWRIHTI